MMKERKTLPLQLLKRNDGQLEWLRRNPRQWTKEDVDRTARSIAEDPDFLEDRPLLVVPDGDGSFIVFAGNLRREGCTKAKVSEAPCVIYHPDTDDDRATILRRAMKDNGSFGSWDFDTLANEWDDLPLQEWGVPAWKGQDEGKDEQPKEKESSAALDKCDLIRRVLFKRMEIAKLSERSCREQGRQVDAEYYLGRGHGCQQAIDLLGESVESIGIELFEDNNGNEGHTAT